MHIQPEAARYRGNTLSTPPDDRHPRYPATMTGLEAGGSLFQHVFDRSPVAIHVIRVADGRSVAANASFLRFAGYTREELAERSAMELVQFADAEERVAWMARLAAGVDVVAQPARVLSRTGEVRETLTSLTFLHGPEGPLVAVTVLDVTEHRRTEVAWRAAEGMFRHVFEAANVGKSITDLDGRVYANHALADLLGYTRDELNSLRWQDMTPAEDIEPTLVRMDELRRTGEPQRFLKRYVRKDGGIVWADVHVAAAGPSRVICTVIDVTDRVAAEAALRASEARFAAAFQRGPAAMSITTIADGRFVDANDAFVRLFGYERDELRGKTSLELGLLQPRQRASIIAAQRASGGLRDAELVAYAKSGAAKRITFSSNEVELGGEACYVTTMLDLTEHHRVADALRASEERFRATFDQAAVGIAHVAPDGRLMMVNRKLCDILGYSREELDGRTFNDITDPEDRAEGAEMLQRLLAGEIASHEREKRYVRKDGTLMWAHLSASIVRGVAGTPSYLVAVIEDISARKQAEAERERLEAQVIATQKMEAIGLLAGGVAHDFNNVLAVILSCADLAADEVPEGHRVREDLEQIRSAAERAAALTRQLLAFSRRQILEPQRCNLNALVSNAAAMLRRILGEDIELSVFLADDLGDVRADPGQLDQVIMNLVVNARDAMTRGGRLTIETANVDDAEGRAWAAITVTDTGIGMDEATTKRVFDPFFTTKGQGRGTGLGLSTVYGIVSQSGGEISVDSKLDVGTTFRVRLPRLIAAPAPRVEAIRPSAPTGDETVLIVEDEAQVRQVAERILRGAGYEVLTAASPGDALVLFETEGCRIDLLVTDMVMPHLSGRDLANRLSRQWPALKVLFMSGYTDDEELHDGRDRQARFLAKPFTGPDLLRKVREVLDGQDGAAAVSPASRR